MTDEKLLEQLRLIMDNMATKEDIRESEARLTQKIEESELRTKIFVENNVSKKIESLFDGYKLTHEKQWELERRMERLEQIIEELQARIA